MNKKMLMTIGGIVTIIVAIGFLIWSFVSTKNYVSTTATVTAVEFDPTVTVDAENGETDNYKVTMEYTVDGNKYTTEITAGMSDYSVGDRTEIKYDPNKPENTVVGNLSLPMVIGIGIAIVVIGGFLIIRGRKF